MESVIVTAVVGAFAALGTHVLTLEATRARMRRELEIELDRDLRSERRKAYCDLWKRLEPLAIYAPKQHLDDAALQRLSASLTVWYYEIGGVYLTTEARGFYFHLQDLLQTPTTGVIRAADHRFQRDPADPKNLLPIGRPATDNDRVFVKLFRAASELRSCFVAELASRAPLIATT